eukprot:gene30524-37759_t
MRIFGSGNDGTCGSSGYVMYNTPGNFPGVYAQCASG